MFKILEERREHDALVINISGGETIDIGCKAKKWRRLEDVKHSIKPVVLSITPSSQDSRVMNCTLLVFEKIARYLIGSCLRWFWNSQRAQTCDISYSGFGNDKTKNEKWF
jgi:hypothetical protein